MTTLADDPRRSAVDETVTCWPEVKAKPVFGHRGYVRGHAMFGFLADDGVAVKLVADMNAEEILAGDGVALFAYNGMPMNGWAVLPVRDDTEMDSTIELLHVAYEAVAK
jgi:hypothetical protein